MKKNKKEQIIQIVSLLAASHGEIRRLSGENRSAVLPLLTDCQGAAIAIGNQIEALEGEDHPAVKLLENYCELLYQLNEELSGEEKFQEDNTGHRLKELLTQIEYCIRNHITVRKVAVFLPYKASMWDSLESVWKAADESAECDAYVVPIPYYDKNADGSFREEHYEGGMYPNYVPITNYKRFDFEDIHPDMIFVHNPYDDFNIVTSVHPFFYTKNLKKYTNKLIYIPYFVLGDIDPNNEKELENMQHFAQVPGVANADVVVVQSENMRQCYIESLVKVTGPHTRSEWGKKILGTGSPKFDKVSETRKEDVEIPQQWKKMIQKEDGSYKKVIFYNTSITALLKYNERMLQKMHSVFHVFQKYKDEIVLLWRPHPLMEATISSMRPQLWREYKRTVRQYKEAGWGIYDDSSELERAIALADGYYGDPSSVVQLCRNAGIPVIVQSPEIIG